MEVEDKLETFDNNYKTYQVNCTIQVNKITIPLYVITDKTGEELNAKIHTNMNNFWGKALNIDDKTPVVEISHYVDVNYEKIEEVSPSIVYQGNYTESAESQQAKNYAVYTATCKIDLQTKPEFGQTTTPAYFKIKCPIDTSITTEEDIEKSIREIVTEYWKALKLDAFKITNISGPSNEDIDLNGNS